MENIIDLDSSKTIDRTYYIYKCVSKRNDDTTIERIIKIQSFFEIYDLGIALIVMSEKDDYIDGFTIKAENFKDECNEYDKKIWGGICFCELISDRNIFIEIKYQNGYSLKYDCEYVGMDIADKKITRKTPICISGKGYSNKTHKEYLESRSDGLYKLPVHDNYYNYEENLFDRVVKDLRCDFTFYKSLYYHLYDYE